MGFSVPEQHRKTDGLAATCAADGNNGVFIVPVKTKGRRKVSAQCIASDGMGWEHVSVVLAGKAPSWDQMCFIKALFWSEESTVVQMRPPESDYVNNNPYCLHLWRKLGSNNFCDRPPNILVGFK